MRADRDRGSAVVEFVLVAPLVLFMALAVVQVALVMHARATLTAAAEEGARTGALAGADAGAGVRRARAIAEQVGIPVRGVTAERTVVAGLAVMTVVIDAELPLLGLLGPADMRVEGHALLEEVS